MKKSNVLFSLVLTILLLVFGAWILAFFRSTLSTRRIAMIWHHDKPLFYVRI